MNRRSWIVIDSLRGEARLGEISVPITDAGSSGELQIGGRQGTVLRPLTFGERSRVVARAALSSQPVEGICAGILQMATVQQGTSDQSIPGVMQEILALVLAGADQEQAPSFAETTLLVAYATGWSPAQLAEAQAVEVDRLAIHLGNRQGAGWSRIRLTSESVDPLTIIRTDLANTLIRRSDTAPGDTAQALAAGSTGMVPRVAMPMEESGPAGASIPPPRTARPRSPGDGGSSHTPPTPAEMARRTSATHRDSRRHPAPVSGGARAPLGTERPSTVASRGRSSHPGSQPDAAAADAALSASLPQGDSLSLAAAPPPGLRLVKHQALEGAPSPTALPGQAVHQIRSPGHVGTATHSGGSGTSAVPPSSIPAPTAPAFAAVSPISTSTGPAGAAPLATAGGLAAARGGAESVRPVQPRAGASFPAATVTGPGLGATSRSTNGAGIAPWPLPAPGGNGAGGCIPEQHALARAAGSVAISESPARVTASSLPLEGGCSLAESTDLSDLADVLGNLLHDEADLRGIER